MKKSDNLADSVYRATNEKWTLFYKFSLFRFLAHTLNLYKMYMYNDLDCSKCTITHSRKNKARKLQAKNYSIRTL